MRVGKISAIAAGPGPEKRAIAKTKNTCTAIAAGNDGFDNNVANNGYGNNRNATHEASSKGLRPMRSDSAPAAGTAATNTSSASVFDHSACVRSSPACFCKNVGM